MAPITGVLVDTSAWGRAQTKPQVALKLREWFKARTPYTCPVLDLEILYSARGTSEYLEWQKRRRATFVNIPLSKAVGDRALEVQSILATKGHLRATSLPDLLIAACAEQVGATILHYDQDYDHIADITGQSTAWIVPRGSVD